jgi:hypothetical protein
MVAGSLPVTELTMALALQEGRISLVGILQMEGPGKHLLPQ